MTSHINSLCLVWQVVLPLAAEGPQHPLFASSASTHGNAKGLKNRTGRGGGGGGGGQGHAGRGGGGGRGDGGARAGTGAGGVADAEAVENPIHTRPRS